VLIDHSRTQADKIDHIYSLTESFKNGRKPVAKTVNRILSTKVEVEHAQAASQLTASIPHKNLLIVDNNMVKTAQGIYDPMTNDTVCRTGYQITVRNVHLQFMLELNQTKSQCHFKILVLSSQPRATCPRLPQPRTSFPSWRPGWTRSTENASGTVHAGPEENKIFSRTP
jgi:hypothetical protein